MDPPQSRTSPQPPTSKSRSRPRPSHHPHHAAASSLPYLPQAPEDLLLPEGSVTEETVELLHEFVHPRPCGERRAATDDTLVAEDVASEEETASERGGEDDWDALKRHSWYRRPSPWWLLCMTPFSSIAMSACAAPRVEIYTQLACLEHKPEYTVGRRESHGSQAVGLYGTSELFPAASLRVYGYSNAHLSSISNTKPFYAVYDGPSADKNEESKSSDKCAADPTVQAAVAKLIAFMTTSMGILSCLTTAFWGSLSDRSGRTRVLGISVVGLLSTDFIFITVYFFSKRLPGGYWFLMVGPLAEGAFGGLTSVVAAMHAYMADCTAPEARSRVFSLGLGLIFVGMAVGPSVGALLIHLTGQTISVFYFATAVHLVYALLMWFVVPESLAPRAMTANRARRLLSAEEARQAEVEAITAAGGNARGVRAIIRFKRVFTFLSPLSIFAPEKVEAGGHSKKRMDLSLTFIAASYGFSALVMASYQYTFQYAAATFGWTSEEVGYWLSLVGASRASYLTIFLPLAIRFFNRPKPAIQLPVEPSEALYNPSSPSTSQASGAADSSGPHAQRTDAKLVPHSSAFDLGLARASLVLEAVCYTLITLAPTPLSFSVLGMLIAWGGGFNPAVQALALELYARRHTAHDDAETGRLFGAMSVVHAMCSQIFGPAIFGLTYMKTVATYPRAIFWVSSTSMTISLVFICLVRLPKAAHSHGHAANADADADVEGSAEAHAGRETTLVDVDEDQMRGRKLRSGKTTVAVHSV